jgi:chemotaxis protein methyltransferase CheR
MTAVQASTGASRLDNAERNLLELLLHDYGYDFRSVAVPWLKQRLRDRVTAEQLQTVRGLREKVLHDEVCRQRLLRSLALDGSTMFYPPDFYQTFAEKVVPLLRTYPFIRLWQVGCSTGEEAYSMSILLEEAGLYERSRIYATDTDPLLLHQARSGIFPLAAMQEYTTNYQRAGGTKSFSEYYTAKYDGALFKQELLRNVVFSQHNLVTDRSFAECTVILCRNVLIYFDKTLQERVHGLFYDSLSTFGILALGSKESLRFSKYEACYEPVSAADKIYRKVR